MERGQDHTHTSYPTKLQILVNLKDLVPSDQWKRCCVLDPLFRPWDNVRWLDRMNPTDLQEHMQAAPILMNREISTDRLFKLSEHTHTLTLQSHSQRSLGIRYFTLILVGSISVTWLSMLLNEYCIEFRELCLVEFSTYFALLLTIVLDCVPVSGLISVHECTTVREMCPAQYIDSRVYAQYKLHVQFKY